jgi:hypothetical protein
MLLIEPEVGTGQLQVVPAVSQEQVAGAVVGVALAAAFAPINTEQKSPSTKGVQELVRLW